VAAQPAPQQPAPAPQQPAPAPQQPAPAPRPTPAPQQQAPAPASDGEGPNYVTPLVRKLAAEHDVDLSSLKGTGVGGRIRKQDVLAAAEAAKAAATAPAPEQPAAAPAAAAAAASSVEPSSLRGTTEKMSRLRKIIASRMVESLQTSAQLTTVVEVDLTLISRLRAKVKDDFQRREGVKLSYLPFLIKATVDALKVHPKLNATIDTEAEEIHYPATENISIAVDTDKGLVVPVIKNAGDLSIAGLAKKIADLAERTRNNKLSPDDISGGTFTVTNTGSRGALIDTPIVNQPQVAILGTGALVKRPVVITDKVLGETIAIRDMMYLSLSYDHRLVDGADAARFLMTLKERLEEGDFASEFGI
jgi:2-oxoglutarate dehydrogenase E2 component (dihydrolipoamide succinyltransferase)